MDGSRLSETRESLKKVGRCGVDDGVDVSRGKSKSKSMDTMDMEERNRHGTVRYGTVLYSTLQYSTPGQYRDR